MTTHSKSARACTKCGAKNHPESLVCIACDHARFRMELVSVDNAYASAARSESSHSSE